jgi:Type IV secretion system pilin
MNYIFLNNFIKQSIIKLALIFTIFGFALAISSTIFAQEALTFKSLNPFGAGQGIKCLYAAPASNTNPPDCTEATGILNRVEGFLLYLAPAFAVIGIMIGGYKYMQEGFQAKASGAKYIEGSIAGLIIVYSAYFVRFLVYRIFIGESNNGIFGTNSNGVATQFSNNSGINVIISFLSYIAQNILLPLGVPVAITFLMFGGYQLITAGGNPSKVGKGLKTIQNSLIGLVLVLFAVGIISLVSRIAITFFNSVPT